MGNNKKGRAGKRRSAPGVVEMPYWAIGVLVVLVFVAGFLASDFVAVPPDTTPVVQPGVAKGGSPGGESIESRVQQVAAFFDCACGSCGELPLADCKCDMPRGAVEEKAFIRSKLEEGLSIQEVIDLVDEKYGHKIG